MTMLAAIVRYRKEIGMKEFEKWFNENHSLPATIERGPIGRDFKKGCEQSYIAALRMVMRKGMHHYGNDFLAMDLCKDIREELKNE